MDVNIVYLNEELNIDMLIYYWSVVDDADDILIQIHDDEDEGEVDL